VQSNGGSPTSRAAALTIAGQTINVSQAGLTCTYALQSANGSVPAAGATGAVGVVAPNSCGWTATPDPLAPWLTISSAAAAGSGDVNFVAQPNTAASSRTGTLTIAGLPYTVTQAPAPCSYTLGSSNVTVASTGAAGSFTFSAATGGCTPTPVSYASWITASTPAPGTIGYTVVANPTSSTRVGTIRIGEQNFTVTQTGGACGFSLNSYSALFGPAGDTTFSRTVFGSPSALGCSPDYGTNQNFITLGSLSGPTSNIFTLPYIVAPLNSLTPTLRFGNITFGGQIFVVKQTSY
jgi:hypothetical protein